MDPLGRTALSIAIINENPGTIHILMFDLLNLSKKVDMISLSKQSKLCLNPII